jgi:hypothetical protein
MPNKPWYYGLTKLMVYEGGLVHSLMYQRRSSISFQHFNLGPMPIHRTSLDSNGVLIVIFIHLFIHSIVEIT